MPDGTWIVGDVQGYLAPLQRVLIEAGLIDSDCRWIGGAATLGVAGDLVDRGPDGVGVIDLLRHSQRQGGDVKVVIGNHDVQLLAAKRFGMVDEWLATGGVVQDLDRLTDAHVEWVSSLPAMVLVDDTVLVHADAMFYRDYGGSADEVNTAIHRVLQGDDVMEWRCLLDRFREHRAFFGTNGEANLTEFLGMYGGTRVVHGHTPIARMLGVAPDSVREAYVYCGGRCINVDPGIYLGGPGFSYRLS